MRRKIEKNSFRESSYSQQQQRSRSTTSTNIPTQLSKQPKIYISNKKIKTRMGSFSNHHSSSLPLKKFKKVESEELKRRLIGKSKKSLFDFFCFHNPDNTPRMISSMTIFSETQTKEKIFHFFLGIILMSLQELSSKNTLKEHTKSRFKSRSVMNVIESTGSKNLNFLVKILDHIDDKYALMLLSRSSFAELERYLRDFMFPSLKFKKKILKFSEDSMTREASIGLVKKLIGKEPIRREDVYDTLREIYFVKGVEKMFAFIFVQIIESLEIPMNIYMTEIEKGNDKKKKIKFYDCTKSMKMDLDSVFVLLKLPRKGFVFYFGVKKKEKNSKSEMMGNAQTVTNYSELTNRLDMKQLQEVMKFNSSLHRKTEEVYREKMEPANFYTKRFDVSCSSFDSRKDSSMDRLKAKSTKRIVVCVDPGVRVNRSFEGPKVNHGDWRWRENVVKKANKKNFEENGKILNDITKYAGVGGKENSVKGVNPDINNPLKFEKKKKKKIFGKRDKSRLKGKKKSPLRSRKRMKEGKLNNKKKFRNSSLSTRNVSNFESCTKDSSKREIMKKKLKSSISKKIQKVLSKRYKTVEKPSFDTNERFTEGSFIERKLNPLIKKNKDEINKSIKKYEGNISPYSKYEYNSESHRSNYEGNNNNFSLMSTRGKKFRKIQNDFNSRETSYLNLRNSDEEQKKGKESSRNGFYGLKKIFGNITNLTNVMNHNEIKICKIESKPEKNKKKKKKNKEKEKKNTISYLDMIRNSGVNPTAAAHTPTGYFFNPNNTRRKNQRANRTVIQATSISQNNHRKKNTNSFFDVRRSSENTLTSNLKNTRANLYLQSQAMIPSTIQTDFSRNRSCSLRNSNSLLLNQYESSGISRAFRPSNNNSRVQLVGYLNGVGNMKEKSQRRVVAIDRGSYHQTVTSQDASSGVYMSRFSPVHSNYRRSFGQSSIVRSGFRA